jgi:hypothetical protein
MSASISVYTRSFGGGHDAKVAAVILRTWSAKYDFNACCAIFTLWRISSSLHHGNCANTSPAVWVGTSNS